MMKRIFFLSLSGLIFLCAVPAVHAQGTAVPTSLIIGAKDITQTPAFQVFKMQQKSVNAEIQYLINLTRFSESSFWRNGRLYTAEQAADWLAYKAVKFEDDFTSTEEFIDKVASFSRKSGKDYYIVYQNRKRIRAKVVLHSELRRLRTHIT